LAKEEGVPTKFPGIQESSGGTIWNERAFHAFHTATPQAKLGNITTIILLIRLHFFTTFTTRLSQHQTASERFNDRLLFSNTFPLGGWGSGGSGFGTIKVICISDNDGSACTGSEIPYGCIAQFRLLLYASITQKCFTFVLADTCSSHIATHHLGVLHAESPQGSAFYFL
jgi:hypothetical protein